MNKKQQTFVDEMLRHGDKIAAYRTAFPKVKSEQTARSSANRLLQNPEVKEAIEEPKRRIRAELEAELKEQMKAELLSFHEAQVTLTNIIRGTHTTEKWVKEKEGWKTIEVKPTQSNIISALNQFFRLNNHYPQKKSGAELKQEQKAADIAKAEADYKILRAKIPPWPNNPYRHPFGDIYPPDYPGPYFDPQDPNTKEQFLAITEPYRLKKLAQQTTAENNNSHPHVPSLRGTKQSSPNTGHHNAGLDCHVVELLRNDEEKQQQTTTIHNNALPSLPSLRGTKQSSPNTGQHNAGLDCHVAEPPRNDEEKQQQTTTIHNNALPSLSSLRGTKQSSPNTGQHNAGLDCHVAEPPRNDGNDNKDGQQTTTTDNNSQSKVPPLGGGGGSTLEQQIATKYKHVSPKVRQSILRDALRKEGWQTIEDAFNEVYPLYLANQHSKGIHMLKRFEKAKENRNLPPHQREIIEKETGWKFHSQYAGFMRKTRALL